MCPKLQVHKSLCLLACIYKLMGDERLVYHFQYANTLERLTLAQGVETDFTKPDKLVIAYGPLEISVSQTLATLPDNQWMYKDGSSLTFLSFEQPVSTSMN
jgi:hypothetical protein